eukprot:TRINITY_DN3598_c0_g1_i1.p1 TRINITY_DN3598_c0_g1~~TRINITY_DN3598_c0_g1_i1.p1  ORF type:complete len:329 (+),score=36.06 TRINITY_DN3598_c0_g1_i1:100-1086(+)
MRSLHLILVSILLCVTCSGQYVPTNLSCGTPSDVKPVTSFPFTMATATDEHTNTITTWKTPYPDFNTTYVHNGKVVSYIGRSITAFRETNGSTYPMEVYYSVDLKAVTWEAAATNITACEGFYLKTTLENGGIIEIHHYTYRDLYQYTYGEQTHSIFKGQTEHNFYVSNYSISIPDTSLYQFEIYARYPVSVSDFTAYNIELGRFFVGDEANSTLFSIETLPKIDPTIGVVTVAHDYMDYALINNIPTTNVSVIGDSSEMTGAGVLSLAQNETYFGQYSGPEDKFRLATKYGFYITPDDSADGSDSSSVSLFGESIFSSFSKKSWFLM